MCRLSNRGVLQPAGWHRNLAALCASEFYRAMNLCSALKRLALAGALSFAAAGLSAEPAAPAPVAAAVQFTASFDAQGLDRLCAALDSVQAAPELWAGRAELLRAADALLSATPLSVMDKSGCAASGDKHDFFAIGKLAWANPKTADSLPWIRRDGPANPAAAG